MIKKLPKLSPLILATLCLSGCFHTPTKGDPFENFNRPMFALNMDLDHLLMRPLATSYNFVTPKFVQHRVTNVFNNLDEVTSVPNDLLQGKGLFMLNDFWRFVINSTIGLGGMFDVAKHIGLRPHYETFGLTIAYWEGGKTQSPYLVLPFLGPGSTRSFFGKAIDLPTTPYFYIPAKYWYVDLGMRGTQAINYRADLLSANRMIDTSYSPYIFIRNAYTQRMKKIIAENQAETYHSKHVVSSIRMTTKDYENSSSVTKTDNKQGSSSLSKKEAEEQGYILDDH